MPARQVGVKVKAGAPGTGLTGEWERGIVQTGVNAGPITADADKGRERPSMNCELIEGFF
jgi:hypothetical protein